ncbi:DUF397 domain-containing protein [Actinomadura roseirufa]|uniref:DUF397 domain-containing protein n=1 Tax=Actinomadura roseirufa TaxID=2094049 RepID=UPI0013F160A2|nr:DUF397 domain-containing protein [Actinomadura roseirufa]
MNVPEPVQGSPAGEADPEKLIVLRDSKDPAGPVIFLTRRQWCALLRRIKSGDYDPR